MFHTDLTPFGVDTERLATERLARLQEAMKREGLGALTYRLAEHPLRDQHRLHAQPARHGGSALRSGSRRRLPSDLPEGDRDEESTAAPAL